MGFISLGREPFGISSHAMRPRKTTTVVKSMSGTLSRLCEDKTNAKCGLIEKIQFN